MKRYSMFAFVSCILLACQTTQLDAQGYGGLGNIPTASAQSSSSATWTSGNDIFVLEPDTALNFITIDGTAEIRVIPEQIRVVLAVTSEQDMADSCQEETVKRIAAIRKEWADLGVPGEKIVEDFISILPRYEWRLQNRDGEQVRVQQRTGYRMQKNLHIAVKNEAEAMAAINRAFKQGVTDIVTFDYWSSKLNDQREKAIEAAIQAAKKKADALLAVFDARPDVINIQESTAVYFPRSLYRTYEHTLEEEQVNFDSREPRIKAYRPKMTFYNGLQSQPDVRPEELAMRPEIAVISTVRLYYQSPADNTLLQRD